jgi:L-asparaginase
MVNYTLKTFNLGTILLYRQILAKGIYIVMNSRYFNWDDIRKNYITSKFEELEGTKYS